MLNIDLLAPLKQLLPQRSLTGRNLVENKISAHHEEWWRFKSQSLYSRDSLGSPKVQYVGFALISMFYRMTCEFPSISSAIGQPH